MLFACGSSEPTGTTSPVGGDAGNEGGNLPLTDGGGTDTGPPPTCSNGIASVRLDVGADTSITEFCNGMSCFGKLDAAQVGKFTSDSSVDAASLVRFPVDASKAALFSAGLVGATLILHARPDCTQCGSGKPSRAGALLVYPMRSDWEETNPAAMCGVDACHRTGGASSRGWGANPDATTQHIAADVDYAGPPASLSFADAVTTVEVPIGRTMLRAFDAPASGAVSFYIAVQSGLFIFATREAGTGAATLRVDYCK